MAEGAKSKVPSARSVTMPLATATPVPTTTADPLIAVMTCPAFSKVSLANTTILTGVSSLVVTVSLTISETAPIVTFTAACREPPLPSATVTTKRSLPW
ncbi:hypothetical protein D3C72_1444190 [compost metagenome]